MNQRWYYSRSISHYKDWWIGGHQYDPALYIGLNYDPGNDKEEAFSDHAQSEEDIDDVYEVDSEEDEVENRANMEERSSNLTWWRRKPTSLRRGPNNTWSKFVINDDVCSQTWAFWGCPYRLVNTYWNPLHGTKHVQDFYEVATRILQATSFSNRISLLL